jgi:hypothetical protein
MISVAAMLLTLGLLLYVFAPARAQASEEKTRVMYLQERKDAVYENLRDLNFEHKAGKFSEADYESLRTSLENEAGAILAEIEKLEVAGGH